MYRLLLTFLLCLKVASSAPQAKESDITYVKINPVVGDTPAEAASGIRESRIEKLPLTIPGTVFISDTDNKEPDKNLTEKSEKNESQNLSEAELDPSENKTVLAENKTVSSEIESDLTENLSLSESKQSDSLADAIGTEEVNTTDDLSEINPTDDLSLSDTETLSDTVPSETYQSDRRARNFDSIETTEVATEKYEDELIEVTAAEAPKTRVPPKFIPKIPKLSYFQKPKVFQSYSSNNLEIASKRKFISTCTCQKIWNCPKLQITVPRCPDEYFLCCF